MGIGDEGTRRKGRTSLHGFHGIFDLEDVPVGAGFVSWGRSLGKLALVLPEYWDC